MERLELKSVLTSWRKSLRNEQFILSLLAVVIGALAGYGAIVFRELIAMIQLFAFGSDSDYLLSISNYLPWWQLLLAPVAGGLLVGLFVHFVMPGRRNHGVADVIEAGSLRAGRMALGTGIGAALAAATSIGFGASVGREGPVIHLGATIAASIAKRLRLNRTAALTLLGCGVAAGIAASFNAPIAGVFFALEVVIGHYALAAFAPVVIASVVGTIIARMQFGNFPAFVVPEFGIVSFLEFPAFAMLGLVSAAVAGIFMWSIMFTQDTMARLPIPPWSRPAAGGLAVGVIAVFFPQVLGVGYEATDLALQVELSLALLIVLAVAKVAATAISLGSGFAGGVFSPSLFIGAMVGGAFGSMAGTVFPELATSPGAYTIIGMGAVASAVLGAPISTILIVFEITGDYGITIAVMIASAVAAVVTRRIPGKSYFHWVLARRGVDVARDRAAGLLQTMSVREVMNETVRRVPREMKIDEIRELLRVDPHGVFFVVDGDARLCGSLTFDELSEFAFADGADGIVNAEHIAREHGAAALADDSLEHLLEVMDAEQTEHLPVVDGTATRRVIGVVHRTDVLIAHNRALIADHHQ